VILSMKCEYCGHFWSMENNYRNPNSKIICQVCGDTNISVKDLEKSKIDYYAGSPPFPKKKNSDWSFD